MASKTIYTFSLGENTKVHLTLGNRKIGKVINFSTLPGNATSYATAKGNKITNVIGTCGQNCGCCFNECYAKRSLVQHHNAVAKAWGENTLLIRYRLQETMEQIQAFIDKHPSRKLFRWNVSGELENVYQLEAMNELAIANPQLKFGIYTKNFQVVRSFVERGNKLADNFALNLSQWHDNLNGWEDIANLFNRFIYDDNTDPSLKAIRKCKAVNEDGTRDKSVKCEECGYCYENNREPTRCPAH